MIVFRIVRVDLKFFQSVHAVNGARIFVEEIEIVRILGQQVFVLFERLGLAAVVSLLPGFVNELFPVKIKDIKARSAERTVERIPVSVHIQKTSALRTRITLELSHHDPPLSYLSSLSYRSLISP